MNTVKRSVAAAELVLIFPAVLFLAAVLFRSLQPSEHEPARTAQQIVMWYAGRQWTLWVLLIALPLTVLVTGGATLLSNRTGGMEPLREQPTALFVAATTLTAGVVLVIVVLHMLAN